MPLARVSPCLQLQFIKWPQCRNPPVFEHLSSKQSRSLIWIVTKTSNRIDSSLCRLSHQMQLLNSAMSLTTHNMYLFIYLLTCTVYSVRPVVVSSVYRCNKWPVQNTHFFLKFYPRSTWSSPPTLVKEKKKKISQQVIHCSIVLLRTMPGNWDIVDVLELWSRGESPRDTVWVWCLHEMRGCRPGLTSAWHSFQVCASKLDV